ncbi:MAG TPA: A24 family peptidase [Elusimicrobiota bacterium]|nr:A24 family peptidase [Elusimicrobiota bacterium]
MEILPTVLAFWFGSVYGSFLNVVVHRLPREESLVRPRSRCPRCKAAIAWYDNVPILSWLLLRGRCRRCRKPISARYPLVEAAAGLLAAGLQRRWPDAPAWIAAAALACGALLAVALIDWDTFLIPDELSIGLLIAGLLAAPLNPYFAGAAWWQPVLRALLGAVCGFAMGWGLASLGEFMLKKEALGGGDVKLLAGVGAWAGATGAFDCLLIGSLIGSVYGVRLLLAGKAKRSDPIPFGPFLAAGAVFNFFLLLPLGWPMI